LDRNTFDAVAPYYNLLARLFIGSYYFDAQCQFLDQIPENSRILILGGGGDGWLLERIPESQVIHFMDKSEKMMSKAKSRNHKSRSIEFIHADYMEYDFKDHYDCIIANYFFDVFNEHNLHCAINKTFDLLGDVGKLLVSDFQNTKRKADRVFIDIMHLFFRISTNLESRKLKPIDNEVRNKFVLMHKKNFKNDLIFSAVYQKQAPTLSGSRL